MKAQTKWLLGAGAGAAALGVGAYLWKKGKEASDVLTPDGTLPDGTLPVEPPATPGQPAGQSYGSGPEAQYVPPPPAPVSVIEPPPAGDGKSETATTTGGSSTVDTGGAGTGTPQDPTAKKKYQEALAQLQNLQAKLLERGYKFVKLAAVPRAVVPTPAQHPAVVYLRELPGASVWNLVGVQTADAKQMWVIGALKARPSLKVALAYTKPAASTPAGVTPGTLPPTVTPPIVVPPGTKPPTPDKVEEFKKKLMALAVGLAQKGWKWEKDVPLWATQATLADKALQMAVGIDLAPVLAADPEAAKAQGLKLEVHKRPADGAAFAIVSVKGAVAMMISKVFPAAQPAQPPQPGTPQGRKADDTKPPAGQAMLDRLGVIGWKATATDPTKFKLQGPTPEIQKAFSDMLRAAGLTPAAAVKAGLVIKFYVDEARGILYALATVGGQVMRLSFNQPWNAGKQNSTPPGYTPPVKPPVLPPTKTPPGVAPPTKDDLKRQITAAMDKLRAAGLTPVAPANVPPQLVPVPNAGAKKYYDLTKQIVGPKFKVDGYMNPQKTVVFVKFTGIHADTKNLPVTWLQMKLTASGIK